MCNATILRIVFQVLVFYVFAVTSCSFCGLSMVYSIWGAAVCAKEDTDKCGTNYTVEVVMNMIGAVTAIFLLVVCIVVSIMFCYYRKAFQFYSQDQIRQMQMILMQQQQLTAAQNAGQPFQTTTLYSSPPTGFGTNWSQAPPPYSETQYSKNNQYIIQSNLPLWSPLLSSHLYLNVFFFLSCNTKRHIYWTSFKRSPVWKDHVFFVQNVTF